MAGIRLQHVRFTFPPGRADDVRAFYGSTLGIPEMPVPPEVADKGWVWFATRDEGIELHFIPTRRRPIRPAATTSACRSPTWRRRNGAWRPPALSASSTRAAHPRPRAALHPRPAGRSGRAGRVRPAEPGFADLRGVAQPGGAPGWGRAVAGSNPVAPIEGARPTSRPPSGGSSGLGNVGAVRAGADRPLEMLAELGMVLADSDDPWRTARVTLTQGAL